MCNDQRVSYTHTTVFTRKSLHYVSLQNHHQYDGPDEVGSWLVEAECFSAMTDTEPALAASPAADQLQTHQTVLPGYFFPTARLPR